PDILERTTAPKNPRMKKGNDPDESERENHRRTKIKNALKIFAEGHGGESDGRGETDRCRNKAGHESRCRMINLGQKMIFAAGTRKRGAEFAVAKRATKRGNSADDPQH